MAEKVGQVERVGNVFHGDVVGDDELFQAVAQRLAEWAIRLDPKGILGGTDADIGFQLALGGDDGGPDGLARLKFCQILGDLPVEKADPVVAGKFQEGAGTG